MTTTSKREEEQLLEKKKENHWSGVLENAKHPAWPMANII